MSIHVPTTADRRHSWFLGDTIIIMAVRGPDPHNLRVMARQSAPIIESDRLCVGCGYNLRGLRLGVKCPECGLPSTVPEGIDDPLSHMPMRVILALVRGCWVASICVMLIVAAIVTSQFGVIDQRISMAMIAGISLIWFGAVFWLTPAFGLPQAISRGFGPNSRLRIIARWLQIGWVIGTGAAAALAFIPTPKAPLEAFLGLIQMLGFFTGLVGVVVLSILMERLAEWARDEDAQKMFNWASWSWPIALLLYGPIQFFLSAWMSGAGQYRFHVVMVALWVLAIATFPYGLLLLAKSVTLTIVHNIEYQGRIERKLERDQRFYERTATRSAGTDSHPMRQRPRSERGNHG